MQCLNEPKTKNIIKHLFICVTLFCVLFFFAIPARAESNPEFDILKDEIKKLNERILELENNNKYIKKSDTHYLVTGYDNGFVIKSMDDAYKMRIKAAIQLRYTYMDFDRASVVKDENGSILGYSNEDWNNFFVRRARLYIDGNAPTIAWKYFLHLQLEPKGKVNLHDAYIQWQRFNEFRIQAGRMKIPYGLEFWQSGFGLNGVARTIFTGETDIEGKAKDIFGNRIEPSWPGGNSIFPVSSHTKKGILFPLGGLLIYRSQGINLNGDINGLGKKGLIQYWTGIFNGRDTQGASNPTSDMLYVMRIALNPLGKFKITQQGDVDYTTSPKICFLMSGYTYKDRATKYIDVNPLTLAATNIYHDYDIEDIGLNGAILFRYKGFSMDAEYGWENFDQQGSFTGHEDWNRQGYRLNLGYFLIKHKLEIVAKHGYIERICDSTPVDALKTGLGLIEFKDGRLAYENNLQDYILGINYYFKKHNLRISADYSYLLNDLKSAHPELYNIKNQIGNRVRAMLQFIF